MTSVPYIGILLAALALGVAGGAVWPFDSIWPAGSAVLMSMVAAARLLRPIPRSGMWSMLLAAFLFGAASCSARLMMPPPAWVRCNFGQAVCVDGWVESEPVLAAGGYYRLHVRADRLAGRHVAPARIDLLARGITGSIEPGDRVNAGGILHAFEGPDNPGDRDPRLQARIHGCDGQMTCWTEPVRRVAGTPARWAIARPAGRFRKALESINRKTLPSGAANLLNGIVLGDDQGMDPRWRQWFQRSGTVHILTVSGLHVGLVGLGAFGLLRRCRAPDALALGGMTLLTTVYIAVAGMQPAGIRAGIMALAGTAGRIVGRRITPANGLMVAALLMLAFDPLLLFDAGFQLSFAATAGVCMIGPAFLCALGRDKVEGWGGAIAASLGAQAAIAPLTALYFGVLTPISLVGNLVLVPLATAALYTGLVAGLAGLVFLPLAAWLNTGTELILAVLVKAARVAAGVPWASVPVAAPGPAFLTAYYLVLALGVAGALLHADPYRARRIWLWGLAISAGVFCGFGAAGLKAGTRLTVLDVGQGAAVLVEFGADCCGVADGGPTAAGSAGVLQNALQRGGIGRLGFAAITHLHDDHLGGLLPVMEHWRLDRLVIPPAACRHARYSQTRALAARRRIPVRPLSAGGAILAGDSRVRILWPPAGDGPENDYSLVMAIETCGARILITGDVGTEVLEHLARERPDDLRCSVLVVPHHGSRHSLSESFYAAAQPRLSVIPVGRNRYGHPDDTVIQSLKRYGSVVWTTLEDGGAVIEIAPGGLVTAKAWRRRGLLGLWLWRREGAVMHMR